MQFRAIGLLLLCLSLSRDTSRADDDLDTEWKQLEQQFDQAKGWLDHQFALCQTATLEQALDWAVKLKTHGLRPLRIRPYPTPEGIKAAALWGPADRETEVFYGSVEDIRLRDQQLRLQNFQPVDIAGYPQFPDQLHVAIWAKRKPNETFEVDMFIARPAGERYDDIVKISRPITRQIYWTQRGEALQDQLRLRPKTVRHISSRGKWDFVWSEMEKVPGSCVDISVASRLRDNKPDPTRYTAIMQSEPKKNWVKVHERTVEGNVIQWKKLAAKNFEPVAIGVAYGPEEKLVGLTIWYERDKP